MRFALKLNREQKLHLARSFQTIAVGQFVFFGYHAIQNSQWLRLIVPAIIYVILELAALFVLTNKES